MRRTRLAALVLAGAALVLIATAPPDSRLPLARVAIFAAGLVVAFHVIRRVAPAVAPNPDLFDVEPKAPATPSEVAGLGRIEFDLQMATTHPFGVEWVKPLLRELAAGRLLSNRGIDMERAPDAARLALGEPLWRLVGDGSRWTVGEIRVSSAEIEAGVARLEQL